MNILSFVPLHSLRQAQTDNARSHTEFVEVCVQAFEIL